MSGGGEYLYQGGRCGGCGREMGTLIGSNGGRHRRYHNNACKQRAYRNRQRADRDANRNERKSAGVTVGQAQRNIDMRLYLMKCPECNRSIWMVYGNVMIGKLICGLCGVEFR